MPITWDAEMDRNLFLAILKVHDISVDNKAVAEEVTTDDQPCTAMAIQKRFQKIKSQITGNAGKGEAVDSPEPKGPSRKRNGATTGEESPAKKGKAKAKPSEHDDGKETKIKEEEA